MTRRAGIVGLGLIGGSLGLALKKQGWHVIGSDIDPGRTGLALEARAIDEVGDMANTDIAFVATPVGQIADAVARALDDGARTVTDVGSVKAPIAQRVQHRAFVPGHPMAGSEQEGISGARADLFHGAVWVLTPTVVTDDESFAQVRGVIVSLGADVVVVDPAEHDRIVAVVSHVPHLAAGALMRVADERSEHHGALLRLAAGGFRDMTRIAAGHPAIWPDICVSNAAAITEVLDDVIASLQKTRQMVAESDREALLWDLEQARSARLNLPTGLPRDADLSVIRIPVLDRPGELATITRLATDIDVNILDLEIAHSSEGRRGVVIVVVPTATAQRLVEALVDKDYSPSVRAIG